MAVVWRRQDADTTYEVRGAGRTRRLYRNGVFHSQWHPRRFLTTNVWDLLSLPSLFLPPEKIQRILVLGVGGGAVLRQLGWLYPKAQQLGVEWDATHLYVARKFFGLRAAKVKLIHAEAISWLQQYRGPKFDLIIEDLFTDHQGQPVRVKDADRLWFAQLNRHLQSHGLLIVNFISTRELRRCAYFHSAATQKKFQAAYGFTTRLYENEIGVFARQVYSLADWWVRLQQHGALYREYRRHQHKYRIRILP
ncbi:MAG: oxidoreductase [Gammaproteobacteria bacterium]|nr:oxidoreductase [Gammaproteobacteria bacterium]